jgi:chromosome segregation ATPase
MYTEYKLEEINYKDMPQEELVIELGEENELIQRCNSNIIRLQNEIEEINASKNTFIGREKLIKSLESNINSEKEIIEAARKNILEISKLILAPKPLPPSKTLQPKANYHQARKGYSN